MYLVVCALIDRRERLAQARMRNHAAQVQQQLANRQVDDGLILESDQRQEVIEDAHGPCFVAGLERIVDRQ